jgi:hypothetical protein
MTLEEFRRLADTWGGDIERWPARWRAEARQCAATEEGASILSQARQLDALLATPPVVTIERVSRAAIAVVQRIAAAASGPSRPVAWWRPTWLMPVAGLALSALIGASLATLVPYGGANGPTSVLGAILDTGSLPATWVMQ